MKLTRINNLSFNGKIIDSHAHYGHWGAQGKNFDYNSLDTFIKNPLNVNIDGKQEQDYLDKVLVSSLDAIGDKAPSGRLDEVSALRQALDFAQNNEKISILAVCQPNLTNGNAHNLRDALSENSKNVVGLKFHPRVLAQNAAGENVPADSNLYDDYMKLAQERKLPCLFHCDSGDSGANKIYNLVKGKFSDVPVILGHSGAGGDDNFQEALRVLTTSIDNNDAKIYADISWLDWQNDLPDGNHQKVKTLITELKKRNALDRILFGTDAPLGCFGENPVNGVSEKEAYEKTLSGLKTMIKKNFSDEADDIIDKVFYKNAQNLFFENVPSGVENTVRAAENAAAQVVETASSGTSIRKPEVPPPTVKAKNKVVAAILISSVAIAGIAAWLYKNKSAISEYFKK